MFEQPAVVKTRSRPWRFDRTVGTLLLSLCLLLLIAWLPKSYRITGNQHLYWQEKMTWQSCADMVLAGNSRVYHGIAPRRMGRELHDLRIVNYGFSAVGYSPEYLDAIERLLDPHSRRPAIVLGISPASLMPANEKSNKFLDLRGSSSTTQLAKARYCGDVLQVFHPLTFREVMNLLRRSPEKHGASARNFIGTAGSQPAGSRKTPATRWAFIADCFGTIASPHGSRPACWRGSPSGPARESRFTVCVPRPRGKWRIWKTN